MSNQRRNVLSNEKHEKYPCNEIIFSKKKLVHVKTFKTKIVSNLRVAHLIIPPPQLQQKTIITYMFMLIDHIGCLGLANARNQLHSQHNLDPM
jgi:hypothetical protein